MNENGVPGARVWAILRLVDSPTHPPGNIAGADLWLSAAGRAEHGRTGPPQVRRCGDGVRSPDDAGRYAR